MVDSDRLRNFLSTNLKPKDYETAVDNMLLLNEIRKSNPAEHQLIKEQSFEEGGLFNLSESLEDKGIDTSTQNHLVNEFKEFQRAEYLIIQNYLKENPGKTQQNSEQYLKDVKNGNVVNGILPEDFVLDGEELDELSPDLIRERISDEIKRINESYKDKKQDAIELIKTRLKDPASISHNTYVDKPRKQPIQPDQEEFDYEPDTDTPDEPEVDQSEVDQSPDDKPKVDQSPNDKPKVGQSPNDEFEADQSFDDASSGFASQEEIESNSSGANVADLRDFDSGSESEPDPEPLIDRRFNPKPRRTGDGVWSTDLDSDSENSPSPNPSPRQALKVQFMGEVTFIAR
jgi:hypothetical protein